MSAAAPCPTNHDALTLRRTNRRVPARCNDCGAELALPDVLGLFIFWIEEDRRRMGALEARVAALEAGLPVRE